MRWYVSIGMVLVLGAIAWGDVAGIAAPSPKSRFADAKDNVPSVNVELVIAVDISYSMDMDELAVQREGYAQAIVSKDFLRALRTGPSSKVAVTYFEWSMSGDEKIIIPWRVIDGPESADVVAAEIMKTPVRRGSSTSISGAAEMGDQTWRRLLDSHDELAKQMVEKHGGTLIKTTGDGILATFDGPGRAVRCALALGTASKQIGLPLRAGLHTGEIEIRGRDIGGIAVHVAARVMAQSASCNGPCGGGRLEIF